jgi:hypothetical protein
MPRRRRVRIGILIVIRARNLNDSYETKCTPRKQAWSIEVTSDAFSDASVGREYQRGPNVHYGCL